MSHQCLADALRSWEAHYAYEMRCHTWGHLAPKRNKTYRGHIVFAIGCYDSGELNPTPLECEFAELYDSPWFYDALIELLQSIETEVGCVYRWEGTFRNYKFKGIVRRLELK